MGKEKILPFESNPLSIMYHYTAFPLVVLQANMTKEVFDEFISTKYINCVFVEKSSSNKFNIGEDLWFTEERILLRHRNILSRKMYDHYKINVIDELKKVIDWGYYPQGNYNEEWIPGKFAYKKFHFYHDYLLIGYNDDKKIFYSIGYLANNQFTKFQIPYENMKMALETLFNDTVSFDFLEYNSKKKYEFSAKKIVDQMENYLNSKGDFIKNEIDVVYGISAIYKLIEYINKTIALNGQLDIRYVRGFLEHKFFMKQRIQYLLKKGYLKNETLLQASTRIYEIAAQVQKLSIKYILSNDINIISRIEEMIKNTIGLEKEYLSKTVSDLSVREINS